MGKIIHTKLASAFERALKNEDILFSSDALSLSRGYFSDEKGMRTPGGVFDVASL